MTGKTHQLLGISAGLTFYFTKSPPTYSPATLAGILIGSHLLALLPDFDQEAAKFWDSLPFGHIAGNIADPFFKHRGITHSLAGFILVSFGLFYLLKIFPTYWGINIYVVYIASMIGYASHIFSDMFTEEGVPLLYPIKRSFGIPPKPFEHIRIITGKWFENLIIFPLINIYLIILLWSYWSNIKLILFL